MSTQSPLLANFFCTNVTLKDVSTLVMVANVLKLITIAAVLCYAIHGANAGIKNKGVLVFFGIQLKDILLRLPSAWADASSSLAASVLTLMYILIVALLMVPMVGGTPSLISGVTAVVVLTIIARHYKLARRAA